MHLNRVKIILKVQTVMLRYVSLCCVVLCYAMLCHLTDLFLLISSLLTGLVLSF